jgi:hypothetical protein
MFKRGFFTLVALAAVGFFAAASGSAYANCGSCGVGEKAEEHAEGSHSHAATAGDHQKQEAKVIFTGNTVCPIMGGKTNPKLFAEYSNAKTHTYAKLYMCCPGCTAQVKKDPAAAYQKVYLDRQLKNKEGKVVAKKGEPLVLKNQTCPVSGEKANAKYAVVYNGMKVSLCCPGCEKAFVKNPDKTMTKVLKSVCGDECDFDPKEAKQTVQQHAAAHLSK